MSSFWVAPPEWSGETAFLLGCGPSLGRTDVSLLEGLRTIAINDAYLRAPWAEILYFCDRKWWQQQREQVSELFRGRWVVTCQEHGDPIHQVHTLRCSGPEGLEADPGALRHGSNSGYQAINLAYHLGAKRIVLLGYDLHVNGHQLHWQHRIGDRRTPEQFDHTLRQVMLPRFATLVEPLRAAGVEVINSTPGSALTCWPYRPLVDVLREV